MALDLQRLIRKVQHMDITLVAGAEGKHNLVSWVHMIETTEAASFLEGGEIAIVTGLGTHGDPERFLQLIQHIHQHKAAGIIVNTGPFIDEIPPSVISFCNENKLPLYQVPWKVHLAEIMRIFCFSITKEDQKNMQLAAALKNALFFPTQEELYLVPLSQQNFNIEWSFNVCVMKLITPSGETDLISRLNILMQTLDHYARHHHYQHFSIFIQQEELLIVAGEYEPAALMEFLNDLYRQAIHSLSKGERLYFGVGRSTKSVRCLHKSYAQACAIVKLHESGKLDETLNYYSQLGIYQLLLGIENQEIIKGYYAQTLKPLIEYDQTNNSDLCQVLECYLSHNGSVKEAADELFVHRNTINYKLSKISEILDVNLSMLQTRLELMISFMIHKML